MLAFDALDRRHWRRREYGHCSDARRHGALVVERFARSEIYDRDGGTCGVCGRPVPADEATLDHVVPLSRRGVHTRANVRVAHLACNATRAAWNIGDARMGKYRHTIPRGCEAWAARDREFWRQVAQDLEALWARCGYEPWVDVRRWL